MSDLEQVGSAAEGPKYKLERLIGQGSFGLVYRATQLGLDRAVAVKVLHPDALGNMEQVGRFLNEARVTASLRHPHIVEVIDHGVAGEQPWIAYEYLPGATLRALLPPHGFPQDRAVQIAIQIASALEEAHRRGVVHRDVKPENVMEAEPGHFKVTDFGLAKWANLAAFRTAGATCLGTPAYVAPEMIATGRSSPFTDQYAVGVLLYELLTGHVPFAGETAAALVEQHLKHTPPAPSAVKPGLAKALDRLVLRALAKDPHERFPEMGLMRAALEEIAADVPSVSSGSFSGLPRSRPTITAQVAMQALTALAIAVLVIMSDPFRMRAPRRAVTEPAPVARAAPRIEAAEAALMRGEIARVLARQDDRAVRTKWLAGLLNPIFLRLGEAAPQAIRLETEIRTDWVLLSGYRDRLNTLFPDPATVPDEDAVLHARVLVMTGRTWCWLENMSATREAIDNTLSAHGDQTHDSRLHEELERRVYRAGGDALVVEAASAVKDVLTRVQARPALASLELAELAVDFYWLATVVVYRKWPEEARPRIAGIGRSLKSAGADTAPLPALFTAIWETGNARAGQVTRAREVLKTALDRLAAAPEFSDARAIAARIERELLSRR
jgi:hypothetical protein